MAKNVIIISIMMYFIINQPFNKWQSLMVEKGTFEELICINTSDINKRGLREMLIM